MEFVKIANDLLGLGKKIQKVGKEYSRTQGVLKNVIGKVINMGMMLAMLAGAVKYGIEFLCSSSKSSRAFEIKPRTVTGMAA